MDISAEFASACRPGWPSQSLVLIPFSGDAVSLAVSSKSWDTPTQLLPVLQRWVVVGTSGFMTWVDRQLQQEDWRPLGTQQ